MKYFRAEENPTARLPENFMQGFLEVSVLYSQIREKKLINHHIGAQLGFPIFELITVHSIRESILLTPIAKPPMQRGDHSKIRSVLK